MTTYYLNSNTSSTTEFLAGTITTDGTIGALSPNNIVGWNLTIVDNDISVANLNQNNSTMADNDIDLTATTSSLVFTYQLPDPNDELTISSANASIEFVGTGIAIIPWDALILGINGVYTTVPNNQLPYIIGKIGFLFSAGADIVDFDNLTAEQQAAIAGGADIYHGLGGSDVVTLPNEANYNESVGNGKTLGWTDNPAISTFYTGSRVGDTYTVNGGDGDYYIVEGAGTEVITINGAGSSTVQLESGNDTLTISGGGTLVAEGTVPTDTVLGSGFIGDDSKLELTNVTSGGSITFTSGGTDETLQIDGTTMPTNAINGFAPGDTNTIDLRKIPYDSSGGATVFETNTNGNNVLQVVENGQPYSLNFDPSQLLCGGFVLSADSVGGTDITFSSGAVTSYSTSVFPYSGVCQIDDSLAGVGVGGTGFIIGQHTILTAAHVVEKAYGLNLATNILVGPGTPLAGTGVYYPGTVLSNVLWNGNNEAYDFAVVYCPTANFPSSSWFNLQPSYSNGTVNLTGYPDINGPPTTQFNQIGQVTADQAQLLQFGSGLVAVHGDSGGPLWFYDGASLEAVGIVDTVAYGAQFTQDDKDMINAEVALVGIVSPGQTVSNQVVANGNSLIVLGTANDTVVNSGGAESVYGLEDNAIVNDGGYQYIQSGGTANDTVVNDPGIQVVATGGTASGAVLSGGEQDVYGSASATTIDSGGLQIVESGGTTNTHTLQSIVSKAM